MRTLRLHAETASPAAIIVTGTREGESLAEVSLSIGIVKGDALRQDKLGQRACTPCRST